MGRNTSGWTTTGDERGTTFVAPAASASSSLNGTNGDSWSRASASSSSTRTRAFGPGSRKDGGIGSKRESIQTQNALVVCGGRSRRTGRVWGLPKLVLVLLPFRRWIQILFAPSLQLCAELQLMQQMEKRSSAQRFPKLENRLLVLVSEKVRGVAC